MDKTAESYSEDAFVAAVIAEAQRQHYKVEPSRNGRQIDFGAKKLHERHLRKVYPAILGPDADISALIETVAPGRPCTHGPMKRIILAIQTHCDHIRLAIRAQQEYGQTKDYCPTTDILLTSLAAETLDRLEAEVKHLEGPLRKTVWPAMSYMAIPSLFNLADSLLLRIDASAGADPVRAAALRERLVGLRTGFKRTR